MAAASFLASWSRLFRRRSPGGRPPRVLALLAFHDEIRYLPGWFRNVPPQVDGVVALDDGSTDGSGELASAQPSVLELIRRPPRSPHAWDEPENRRLLVEAAARHAPDWLVAPPVPTAIAAGPLNNTLGHLFTVYITGRNAALGSVNYAGGATATDVTTVDWGVVNRCAVYVTRVTGVVIRGAFVEVFIPRLY